MRYVATEPNGKVREYNDFNRAVHKSPHGTVIIDTLKGTRHKVRK